MDRRSSWAEVFVATLALVLSGAGACAEVVLSPSAAASMDKYLATLTPPLSRAQLVEAEVPAVGCPMDGQQGPQEAPKLAKTIRVVVPPGMQSTLALYSGDDDTASGVLAPRGWDCFGTYGSSGVTLYVVPRRLGGAILGRADKIKSGLVVIRSLATGGTSGRFTVAHVSARIFPRIRAFVDDVRNEGINSPKDYVFAPWPRDRLDRLSDFVVSYVTPPHAEGLGTAVGPRPGAESIAGLAFLSDWEGKDDGPNLIGVAIRLDARDQRLSAGIIAAQIAAMK
jgi:hypothetical protein